MPELYERIYLSPHLDDAALSCGGLIYQERQAGLTVLVLTVMAGDAPSDAMISPIVSDLHTRWELDNTPNPVTVRRAEDREAISLLGADVLHWEWPECVYRRHPSTGDFLYPSEASLWGSVHPSEQNIISQLAQRLQNLPLATEGRLLVPLTVGGHVDHLLVRQAAEALVTPKAEMIYYEEYPYAEQPEKLRTVMQDNYRWQAEIVPLEDKALRAKAAAIACYHSQISTFFANTDEIASRLHAYAIVAGEGKTQAERYWHSR